MDQGIELMRVPVISSSHVTRACGEWLNVATGERDSFICGFEGPYGWILFAGEEPLPPDCPYVDVLSPVLAWARSNGYDWVRLDEDGDPVPGLAVYRTL